MRLVVGILGILMFLFGMWAGDRPWRTATAEAHADGIAVFGAGLAFLAALPGILAAMDTAG